MNEPLDISSHLPKQFSKVLPKLSVSAEAQSDMARLADSLGMTSLDDTWKSVAQSAGSFRTSVYFKYRRWFRDLPHHPFRAARFEAEQLPENDLTSRWVTPRKDAVEPVLVLDWRNNRILSETEVRLPESYSEMRVIEEVLAEMGQDQNSNP